MPYICPSCETEPANFNAGGSGVVSVEYVFETITGTDDVHIIKNHSCDRHEDWCCSNCGAFLQGLHPEETWRDE